jgi:hypothetical protein
MFILIFPEGKIIRSRVRFKHNLDRVVMSMDEMTKRRREISERQNARDQISND